MKKTGGFKMIYYEVCLNGNNKLVHEFESLYPYQVGQRLFVKIEGVIYNLLIESISHNHLREIPYVRLNCNPSMYKTE